jgi:hypothetical protein
MILTERDPRHSRRPSHFRISDQRAALFHVTIKETEDHVIVTATADERRRSPSQLHHIKTPSTGEKLTVRRYARDQIVRLNRRQDLDILRGPRQTESHLLGRPQKVHRVQTRHQVGRSISRRERAPVAGGFRGLRRVWGFGADGGELDGVGPADDEEAVVLPDEVGADEARADTAGLRSLVTGADNIG